MSRGACPQLFTSQITDKFIRTNFQKISDFFVTLSIFANFRAFEVEFKGAESHHKFTHGLGFLPKDVLITSKTGVGGVTFNQELTTADTLDMTATDACVVRFLAGAFN